MTRFLFRTAAAATAAALFSMPALAAQLISDRTIGKVLAQVQCGERSMSNALQYLNSMQVPASKLNNINEETKRGYRAQMGWKSC